MGSTGGSAATFFCKGLPTIKSDWSKWKFIFCDERVVPFDNAECTFSVYKNNLYPKMPLDDDNFVVIDPTLPSRDKRNRIKFAFVYSPEGPSRINPRFLFSFRQPKRPLRITSAS